MSEFIKPKTVFVSDSEYIQNLVNINLKKDLHDDEEICQHCHGTGMVITNNPYGLSDDPNRSIGTLFPYQHQSITFCLYCYNGIVHRCILCGQIMPRGRLKHDCEQQREIDRAELAKKEAEEWQKAPIAPKEVEEACFCLYSEYYPHNEGYFCDWDEFFESWAEEHEPDDKRPEFVWITKSEKMRIDAYSIVESATDDLYEDAMDNISTGSIKELQDYLDKWCDNCGVGNIYYENHKYKVRIPWEKYNERTNK